MLLILDINQTLLHASHTPRRGGVNYWGKARSKHIYLRPRLREFLEGLQSIPDLQVGIWTSCAPENAQALFEVLVKNGLRDASFLLDQRFCRKRDNPENPYRNTIKDLEDVWRRWGAEYGWGPHNTFLVDDTISKASRQPENHLHIKEWEADAPGAAEDDELMKLLGSLRAQ